MTNLAAKIKSPIRASRFEINWSAGKIMSPQASGRVLTCTLYLYCCADHIQVKARHNGGALQGVSTDRLWPRYGSGMRQASALLFVPDSYHMTVLIGLSFEKRKDLT